MWRGISLSSSSSSSSPASSCPAQLSRARRKPAARGPRFPKRSSCGEKPKPKPKPKPFHEGRSKAAGQPRRRPAGAALLKKEEKAKPPAKLVDFVSGKCAKNQQHTG